jgi:hypothetical protein
VLSEGIISSIPAAVEAINEAAVVVIFKIIGTTPKVL